MIPYQGPADRIGRSVLAADADTPLDEQADNDGVRASANAPHHIGLQAMHHAGGHSMKWMMPLCVLGMVAGVVAWAGWGVNIGGLFCALMMIAMVWMMIAPTARKVRHRDHASR